MNRSLRAVLLLAGTLLAGGPALAGVSRSRGLVAAGTPSATPYFVVDSQEPGPVIVVVGGMHGNEPAGAHAAEAITHWTIQRGKLVVIPRANPMALRSSTRFTPGADRSVHDLNRNFSRAVENDDEPRGRLASALWELVAEQKPDWLLDLHEGFDFNRINPKSVGSTIVVGSSPEARAAAGLMIEAVNARIDVAEKKFRLRGPPVNGSLARAAAARLGARVMILETTFKEQKISCRARQHRVMVHRFLQHLDVAAAGPHRLVDAAAAAAFARPAGPPVRVGIYDDGGVVTSGPQRLDRILGERNDAIHRRLGAAEIRPEVLAQFDVVVFPGGSGSRQASAIGPSGRKAVRDFVAHGGGYVGICAGAYLATSGYDWGLKILDARTITGKHWRRGRGTVQMELTAEGARILGQPRGLLSVRYVNGPIVAAAALADVPDFTPLAYYRSELAENGSPPGLMTGTPAITAGDFGRGRVLSISPHPEQTAGLEPLVPRAILWAAGR